MTNVPRLLVIDGHSLSIQDVVHVAHDPSCRVELSLTATDAVNTSRAYIEGVLQRREVVYGLTTGFGNFKKIHIPPDLSAELQRNLIMSHAVGVGKPFSRDEVRAMMLIRINSLIRGNSGIRLSTIETMVDLLNKNVYPYVPEQGSVGASGDLAPLAHIALVLIGEGEAWLHGRRVPAREALTAVGAQPVVLAAKEGLALTNGTSMMSAVQSWNCWRARNLVRAADIIGTMSLEAMMGSMVPSQQRIADLRRHPGHAESAGNIRALANNSPIVASHANCDRVQDSYVLRCMPQVHGAIRDAVRHVESVLQIELNAVTDNPLIFPDENMVCSAGNFHGEPLALTADYLGIALAELANISERRIAKAIDPATSEGLPAFLIPEQQAGISSGFMIPQYTAAALVSENKVLAHPASVDSIPTSANQEDHVSMGSIAVRKCRDIITNTERVLAIELLTAAQALDFRKPIQPGPGSRAAYELLRSVVPFLDRDRVMYTDMEVATRIVQSGELVNTVQRAVGSLQ